MRYAIDIAPLGELPDPHPIVRLAVAAEAGGWDGMSIWDTLGVSIGTSAPDPFVTLAAVAPATTRLRLITSVIALPRRQPQLVAQSAATLDRWSGGRLVFGGGSGGDPGDFRPFDEPFEPKGRAAIMDENLARASGCGRDEMAPIFMTRSGLPAIHGPCADVRPPAFGPNPRGGPQERSTWISLPWSSPRDFPTAHPQSSRPASRHTPRRFSPS
jgi:alkanesulfonate monooxygenase SsuD/methylene tetrahydromethanopterin reductase-like flavin-dependent oxidoreductase (luciferase family)